eukprot:5767420-Ditylum_brightwellii.AAC.1
MEGERIQTWKREKERVERELQSYLEQYHVLQHSLEFNCVLLRQKEKNKERQDEPRDDTCFKWRIREGLDQYDNHNDDCQNGDDSNSSSFQNNSPTEISLFQSNHHSEYIIGQEVDVCPSKKNYISWIYPTYLPTYMMHCLCATQPIPPSPQTERFYIVRARMKSIRDYGDVNIGIVTPEFH